MSENNTSSTPAPVTSTVTRRIYALHKVYGTCITLGAFVFAAPANAAAAKLDKKSAVKGTFKVTGEGEAAEVLDEDGVQWIGMGENGGCGPRCPKDLKEVYGKAWHAMSFAERKNLLAARAKQQDAAAS